MTVLQLVRPPHKALYKKAKPVNLSDGQLKQLILDMADTLVAQSDPPGVGLAAPQIGVSKQIFLLMPQPGEIEVVVNPEVVEWGSELQSGTEQDLLEGCLSLPKIYGPVERVKDLVLRYQTADLEAIKQAPDKQIGHLFVMVQKDFHDFPARIVQHELDHLRGRLFTSRVVEQGGSLYELVQKNGKEEFVPIEL